MTHRAPLQPRATTLVPNRSRPMVQRKCTRCAAEGPTADDAAARMAASVPDSVGAVLRGGGRPLDSGVRQAMEAGFNRDFSRVRVHSDAAAAGSAEQVGALAYTVGRDIAFASGQYAPSTAAGRHLIAHELAHVVQQGDTAAVPSGSLELGRHDSTAEAEADAAAAAVGNGQAVTITGTAPGHLQRQTAPAAPVGPSAPAAPVAPPPPAAPALPTVSLGNFRTSGSMSAENTCALCNGVTLGTPAATGDNRMEMRGDITGHVAAAQYDIKRTKERATWKLVGTTWTQLSNAAAGSDDDSHNADEMLTPVNSHIYVMDTPGWSSSSANPTGDAAATEAVYKASFTETCNVKVGAGAWTASSNSVDWHSITWLEKVASGWRRKAGANEIGLGSTTVGTGNP